MLGTVKLSDRQHQSVTQKFIGIYTNYKAQGALDDEKIFEVAFEKVQESLIRPTSTSTSAAATASIDEPVVEIDLVQSFKLAQKTPQISLKDYLNETKEG